MALSRAAGWVASRTLPRPLRAPVYRAYARFTGADLAEVRDPLDRHRSLSEFFVRHLRQGARPIVGGRQFLACPCDGTVQAAGSIERGSLLQAKGRAYALADLLGDVKDAAACEGGFAWTIYLSPRDYHRVHVPEDCVLEEIRPFAGARHSVAPAVLSKRLVLPHNERMVFRLRTEKAVLWLVMVGALNVGRIRLAGEEAAVNPRPRVPRRFARGEELARFEMGSTVVLVAPPRAAQPRVDLLPGTPVRLGEPIGSWITSAVPARA